MKEFTPKKREAWLKSLHGNPASAAMLMENPKGELLVVKASYKRYWSLPGGVIDKGESPMQAAIRETAEEVGIVVEPSAVEFAGVTYRTSKIGDTYRFIFQAPIGYEVAESIVLQESEIDSYAFVTKEEVKSGNRPYAPAITQWAAGGLPHYSEQDIGLLID